MSISPFFFLGRSATPDLEAPPHSGSPLNTPREDVFLPPWDPYPTLLQDPNSGAHD